MYFDLFFVDNQSKLRGFSSFQIRRRRKANEHHYSLSVCHCGGGTIQRGVPHSPQLSLFEKVNPHLSDIERNSDWKEQLVFLSADLEPYAYPLSLQRLKLKSIVSLTPNPPSDDLLRFCESEKITSKHIPVPKFKDEDDKVTISQARVAQVIEVGPTPKNPSNYNDNNCWLLLLWLIL